MISAAINQSRNQDILFTSDIHGEKAFYHRLVSFAKQRKEASDRSENTAVLNAVILGGDLFPNSTDRDRALDLQKNFISAFFKDFLIKMKEIEVEVYVLPGNMDFSITVNLLLEFQRQGLMHSLFSNVCTLPQGLKIAGCSFVPPSPFMLKDMEKREYDDSEIPANPENCLISTDTSILEIPSESLLSQGKSLYQELEYLYIKLDGPHILVTHCPPFDTGLDMVSKTLHAGSRAIRRIIEEKMPILSLHGHIHESPDVSGNAIDKIGSTVSVNAGKAGNNLKAAVFSEKDPQNTLKIIEF